MDSMGVEGIFSNTRVAVNFSRSVDTANSHELKLKGKCNQD
jgi:hypothetical protein